MPGPIRPINVNLGHLASNRAHASKPMARGQPQQAPAAEIDLSPAALAAQRELDGIKAQIGDLVDNRGQNGSGFRVEDVYSGLARFRVGNVDFNPGQFVDLDVEITASAQQAGLFLSFGGALDFNAGTSSLTLDISGPLGSIDLVFTSGTVLNDMAAAINTFSPETGVQATVSGTGVVLRSPGYGSAEFVSVQTGGDAFNLAGDGVFSFLDHDANTLDTSSRISFPAAANPVTDHGQDAAAIINNRVAIGVGTLLTYTGPFLTAQIDLKLGALGKGETANAEHLGSFLAGRVLWDGSISPLSDTPPGIDLSG
ncbi:MAG: hypothetical protein K8E66_01690 [Phycisphaerales bacterium]|nr:hypothetical protein [Phycisphaerales bacterium]